MLEDFSGPNLRRCSQSGQQSRADAGGPQVLCLGVPQRRYAGTGKQLCPPARPCAGSRFQNHYFRQRPVGRAHWHEPDVIHSRQPLTPQSPAHSDPVGRSDPCAGASLRHLRQSKPRQKQKRFAAIFIATNLCAYWRRGWDSNPR